MLSVLCVGGPNDGKYVEVNDPWRGLTVAVPNRTRWLAEGESQSIDIDTVHYRLEKFTVTDAFIAPVLVLDSIPSKEMAHYIVPLIFKREFIETRV